MMSDLAHGNPLLFMLAKLALVGLGTLFLWRNRSSPLAVGRDCRGLFQLLPRVSLPPPILLKGLPLGISRSRTSGLADRFPPRTLGQPFGSLLRPSGHLIPSPGKHSFLSLKRVFTQETLVFLGYS